MKTVANRAESIRVGTNGRGVCIPLTWLLLPSSPRLHRWLPHSDPGSARGGRVIVGFSPVEFISQYNAPPGDCCCHLVLYNKHESASSPCADSVCSSASWSFCAFVFSLLSWLSSLTVSLTFCLILCVQASNCCSAFLFPAFLPKALIHPWLLPLESCCRPAALA